MTTLKTPESVDNRIAFIMVSCARDPVRSAILQQVIDNLKSSLQIVEPHPRFLIFDNASTVPGTHQALASLGKLVVSETNEGYWSAVDWSLRNLEKVLGQAYPYVYVIESDLVHSNFSLINRAAKLLDVDPSVGCVRLQKFNCRFPFLYSKSMPRPFLRPDAVSMVNIISGKRVRLRKSPVQGVYLTNFTAKVCALHRVPVLTKVFERLSTLETFNEGHFFSSFQDLYQINGALDVGIFSEKLGKDPSGRRVPSGSFESTLFQTGRIGGERIYLPTRHARIDRNRLVVKLPQQAL